MADMNKLKAELTWHDKNVGICFKEGDKIHEWTDFTKEEQMQILGGLAGMHNLFLRFVKE